MAKVTTATPASATQIHGRARHLTTRYVDAIAYGERRCNISGRSIY